MTKQKENLKDIENLFDDYGKEKQVEVKEIKPEDVPEVEKKLNYKDNNGNVLYGYSQIDLKKNTIAVQNNTKIAKGFLILGWSIFIFAVAMIMYIIKNNVINNIVAHCM